MNVFNRTNYTKFQHNYTEKIPIITTIITIVNIIAFIVYTIQEEMMYNIGSLSIIKVIGDGEYYRILTCMFLHGGFEHLFSNMLILIFLGRILEKEIGPLKYSIVYFGAGIGSGIASMFQEYLTGQVIFSIGASGAIYGIIGAMLVIVIIHHGNYQNITIKRMLFAIVYMLYSGMRNIQVNNAAHIGGLCVGFLIGVLMYLKNKAR